MIDEKKKRKLANWKRDQFKNLNWRTEENVQKWRKEWKLSIGHGEKLSYMCNNITEEEKEWGRNSFPKLTKGMSHCFSPRSHGWPPHWSPKATGTPECPRQKLRELGRRKAGQISKMCFPVPPRSNHNSWSTYTASKTRIINFTFSLNDQLHQVE